MKMRKELNNKGFSLVELMIATVILAIIVAPLLHSFVTAAHTTVKSRQMGDATLASENIAEAVEVAPLKELLSSEVSAKKYFTGATGKSLYTYNTASGTYTPASASDIDFDTENCYYLGVEGIQAGSSRFNAMIKLDANEYRKALKPINTVDLTDYSNMDAVYAQGMVANDPDDEALANLRVKAARYPDYSYSDPIRTITLEVKEGVDAEGDPNGTIVAKLHFDYRYTIHYSKENEAGDLEQYTVTIDTDTIDEDLLTPPYNPALYGNRLPNIYVIYNPMYGEDGVLNDVIKIENKIKKPFKVFLVKERGSNLSRENNYVASVEQYVPSGTDDENYAIIYTNINENLNNEDFDERSELSTVNYRIFTGSYFSRQGDFEGERGDLVSKTDRNRMFEVTVQLFDAADTTFTTPLHTSRSTKLQ
jgi:prepilin-type N-terminal cleavage/methylation domain-containing protein